MAINISGMIEGRTARNEFGYDGAGRALAVFNKGEAQDELIGLVYYDRNYSKGLPGSVDELAARCEQPIFTTGMAGSWDYIVHAALEDIEEAKRSWL